MRPRLIWQDGQPRAVATVYSDPAMERAEAEVLRCFRARFPRVQPMTGAVMLRFTAVFEPPASWPKKLHAACDTGAVYHTSKPDKDNVEKLIVDALKGFAWGDDAQVQGGGVKRYGSPARLDIVLEPLAQSADLPLTPAVKRAEARVAAGEPLGPQRRRRANPPKSKLPASVQKAVDKAVAKERPR